MKIEFVQEYVHDDMLNIQSFKQFYLGEKRFYFYFLLGT